MSTIEKSITFGVPPMDQHNETLVSNVHPPDWVNPTPSGRYNLVVVGGGTAGLVSAAGAAGLGAKVALIERNLMGGDCLNVGCVPSKCVIRSGRVAQQIRDAKEFGVGASGEVEVDFAAVMERMRKIRSHISRHDSFMRFKDLGINVFLGDAEFVDSETVAINEHRLQFRKAVIAAGARAVELPIEGLKEVGCLTNETIFSLTERPETFAVVGAGPIGCEMAQTFQRLGSQVTVLQDTGHVLNREDADAAAIVQNRFIRDGIHLCLNCKIKRVALEDGKKVIYHEHDGKEERTPVDEILMGVGRAPNVDGLGLEKAGVQYNKFGVEVNDYLQTTNPRIFAAGDICMRYKFTHAADFAARIVIQNALFMGSKKLSALTMPWCTYTDPEIAHVGLYEHDAEDQGIEIDTYKRELKEVDRALADGEDEGFVKIHVKKGTDKILGATIVASHAGEMISEISVALVNKIGLGKLANVIHPYPTQAEAIRQIGDLYNRTRLTPFVKKLMGMWLSWTR